MNNNLPMPTPAKMVEQSTSLLSATLRHVEDQIVLHRSLAAHYERIRDEVEALVNPNFVDNLQKFESLKRIVAPETDPL